MMSDLLDAAEQSRLRDVVLGWMGCLLLAQGGGTEEGTVRGIEQNTVDFYCYTVTVSGKVLQVKTSTYA